MAKKKNWLLIILGIVIFVVIVGVAAVVGFGYWVYRQMDFHTTTTGNTLQQFETLRARFQGQVPYVEMTLSDNHEEATVHRELEKPTRTTLTRLRIAVYDEREHRFVELGLPFWLLRLGGNKPINLRQGSSGFDPGVRLTVTTEDLERRGPGLVLDTVGRRGEHVLIWSE
jgi:hypothetical protein